MYVGRPRVFLCTAFCIFGRDGVSQYRKKMDPFEEIRYLGWNLEEVEDFEYSPSHSTLSERLKKTLYLAEGCTDENGISLPVADAAVEVFHDVSGSPLRRISPRHVANLSKRSRVAPCTLLLAMIYARRLKTTNETYVSNMTSADLLLVSMMVASKFLYDEGEDEEMFSDEWAKAANVDLDRVYKLEREFLSAMEWKLFVHSEEFFSFIRQIETRIALSQGLSRGWFSYSDMEVLMMQPCWQDSWGLIVHQGLKVLGICLAIYTVCATAVIWSALLMHHPHLQSPSVCSCLPFTLDSHIKKSTLMHHRGVETITQLPSDGEVCRCQTTERNESVKVAETGLDDFECVEQDFSFTDMTTLLHEKYSKAQHALLVFYRALLTAVSDISTSNTYRAECNEDLFSSDEGSACNCTCNQMSAHSNSPLDTSNEQRSWTGQLHTSTTCQCPCKQSSPKSHWWNRPNGNQTDIVDGTASKVYPWISQWWYALWTGVKVRGDFCIWSAPTFNNRFIDLDMRFATSSF